MLSMEFKRREEGKPSPSEGFFDHPQTGDDFSLEGAVTYLTIVAVMGLPEQFSSSHRTMIWIPANKNTILVIGSLIT